MKHPHPAWIVCDLGRRWWLFLIPIVRSAIFRTAISPQEWLIGGGLLLWSIIRWKRTDYELRSPLTVRQGVWFRRTRKIVTDETSLVLIERTPLLRLLGAARMVVSTAGVHRRADTALVLPARQVYHAGIGKRRTDGYRSRPLPVTVLALSGSNAAIGLLTLAPFLRRFATLLGEALPKRWYTVPERAVLIGLPPILRVAAWLFFAGWLFAVCRTLSRSLGFCADRHGNRLHVAAGLWTHRDWWINADKLTGLLLRQTLFTRLLGLFSVGIGCAGYGHERGDRPILIPAANKRELCRVLDLLIPAFPLGRITVRPSWCGAPRYLLPPLFGIGAVIALAVFAPIKSPAVIGVLLFPLVWWLAIRAIGFAESGVGIENDAITLRFPRGLALYEWHLPRDAVDDICVAHFKNGKNCRVDFLLFNEKQRRFRVYGLPYRQIAALLQNA